MVFSVTEKQMKRGGIIMSSNKSNEKGSGCITIVAILFLIWLAKTIYSYCWIPAIVAIIFFIIKKDTPNRIRNLIISFIVLVTSVGFFAYGHLPPTLENIEVSWDSVQYDISDTAVVEITTYPENTEFKTIEISDTDIAHMRYQDGKAYVTFEKPFSESLYFIADGNHTSNRQQLVVKDMKKEKAKQNEKEEQERIATEKAEQERLAKEQEEQERIAAEQAEQERIAAEQAAQQAQNDPIVYITNTGSKYHNGSCRFLNKSKIEKHLSEVVGIYEPCGVCHPPTN